MSNLRMLVYMRGEELNSDSYYCNDEFVVAETDSGNKRVINVTGDSRMQIVEDVLAGLRWK